jgi:hypothetical protein
VGAGEEPRPVGLRRSGRDCRRAAAQTGRAEPAGRNAPLEKPLPHDTAVPVGLIAAGIGWLMGSLLPAGSAEEQAAATVKKAATPAVTDAAKQSAPASKTPLSRPPSRSRVPQLMPPAMVKDEAASSAHDMRIRLRPSATPYR